MPTATNPLLLVDAPALVPYQYGLASVAQPADTSDRHAFLGVQYEQLGTYQAGVLPGACGSLPSVALQACTATAKGLPFSVFAGVDTAAVGYDEDYILARARAILDLGWQHAAEQALWTGAGLTAPAPQLNAAGVSTTVGSAGMSIDDAVAALENWMANNYSAVATIHARRGISAYASDRQLVRERVGQLQTPVGSRWCFGGGYDGSGPSDVAPAAGVEWIYATGLITVRRADPIISGNLAAALNRTTNAADVFAEQPTVLTIDGPIAAASVDTTK